MLKTQKQVIAERIGAIKPNFLEEGMTEYGYGSFGGGLKRKSIFNDGLSDLEENKKDKEKEKQWNPLVKELLPVNSINDTYEDWRDH